MKTIKLITIMFLAFCLPLLGQTFSLKQCIEYARKNNGNIKIASLDSDISSKMVNEQIGNGLPQINITGSLEDKVKISTSILPGELVGKPGTFIPVKMGTQYNASGGIQLTQKIFDPSFWVGLKAAKISRNMSDQNIQKTDEDVIYDVSTAYYRASIIKKQLDNLNVVLAASERTLKSVELKYQNGLAKKIDVDKIKVSYNATNSQIQQTELSFKQALNNLKFYMGMPVGNSIALPENLPDSTAAPMESGSDENFVENRIDYQMQKTQVELYEADKQNNIAAFLPTLSFYANYNFQAMRTQFDFFKSDKEWYNNSAIGLELKIPVFSGFNRLSKVEQSQLNIEKAMESLKLTEQSIKLELSNYEIQYRNALDNIQTEKENLSLAESVFKNTQLEYTQGTGSSLDLVQTESSWRETQNNYYNKLLTLYIARLDLEKSQGTLTNFINNLK